MNCRPGDLAIYVGSHREHRGKYVRVVRHVELTESEKLRRVCHVYWEIEPKLGDYWKCADSALLPLRPDGITDKEVRELYAPKQMEPANV